jgi:hypothetical protein
MNSDDTLGWSKNGRFYEDPLKIEKKNGESWKKVNKKPSYVIVDLLTVSN